MRVNFAFDCVVFIEFVKIVRVDSGDKALTILQFHMRQQDRQL
jgi:hypothetical protein